MLKGLMQTQKAQSAKSVGLRVDSRDTVSVPLSGRVHTRSRPIDNVFLSRTNKRKKRTVA